MLALLGSAKSPPNPFLWGKRGGIRTSIDQSLEPVFASSTESIQISSLRITYSMGMSMHMHMGMLGDRTAQLRGLAGAKYFEMLIRIS